MTTIERLTNEFNNALKELYDLVEIDPNDPVRKFRLPPPTP
jgi:hypothetical protein